MLQIRVRSQSATMLPAILLFVIGCGTADPVPPVASQSTRSEQPPALADANRATATEDAGPKLRPVPVPVEATAAATTASPAAVAAFQRLLSAAENGSPEEWLAAEEELKGLGAAIVPALIPALGGSEPMAREMAVMFLAQLGPDAAPAATALGDLLDDPSPFVRVNAAALLTTFDNPPEATVPTLIELVEHPEANLRITAISALSNVPKSARRIVAALAPCLEDADPQVRQAAASTLGRLGEPAVVALPQLRHLLDDTDPAVKEAALFAVRVLDPAVSAGDSTTITTSAEADALPGTAVE